MKNLRKCENGFAYQMTLVFAIVMVVGFVLFWIIFSGAMEGEVTNKYVDGEIVYHYYFELVISDAGSIASSMKYSVGDVLIVEICAEDYNSHNVGDLFKFRLGEVDIISVNGGT